VRDTTNPSPSGPEAIDGAIDRLYQAGLDEFTPQRNALAASLKAAGDRAGADRVKSLSKPGATAWAVNQAWWGSRALFDAMLAAGEAERAAHRAFAAGRGADVRAAGAARQKAVAALLEKCLDALGGAAGVTPDVRYRISGTLEVLAASGVPADSQLGRLTRDLQVTGLEAFGQLTAAPGPPEPAKAARPTLATTGPRERQRIAKPKRPNGSGWTRSPGRGRDCRRSRRR
jgi:hypothetical protein